MGARTRERMQDLPFDKVKDMEARSKELLRTVFDKLETANHMVKLLKNERYSHHLNRFHEKWGLSLENSGELGPFVTAAIDKKTEAVNVFVNKDFLHDSTNQELLESSVKSLVKSLNEEYRTICGLDTIVITSPLNPAKTVMPETGETNGDSVDIKEVGPRSKQKTKSKPKGRASGRQGKRN